MIVSNHSRVKLLPQAAIAVLVGVIVVFIFTESIFGWTPLDWIHKLGQGTGYYDPGIGILLLIVVNIISFLILIWRNTEKLHKVDDNWRQEKNKLRQSRHGLEVEVIERTEELRQSEVLKQVVLDALPQHLAVLDQTGTIIKVNQAWQRFMLDNEGAELDNQIGVGANYLAVCRNVIGGDSGDAQQVIKGIELVLTGEIPVFMFEYACHSVTEQRWFRLTVVPLPGENNGAIVTHTNITEHRQLYEAEQQARIRAEEASRMKDEFLATVSHELRSPLNAILGWVNLLRGGKLSNEASLRALATIEISARTQNRLVSDLLDVSRIITGKLRLNVSLVKPVHFIEAALEAARPAADAKEIYLQTVIDENVALISGDADRLQQIVWNLISNAIRFTPRGGRVQVRLEQVNTNVKIIVSDNGSGIKPEFLPFIFDRFSQQDTSITRKIGGLGMGLAIVRHLVELHGGEVEVESAGEGKGATFTINLPLTLADKKTIQSKPSVIENPPQINCPPALNDLRVLVVDDDPEALELVSRILIECGAEVKTAGSVKAALGWLSDPAGWRPEVLVSDLEMPGENGYSLLRIIRDREAPNTPKLPAIALTANARAEDRMRTLGAGFQMHVPKPVEPAELLTVVASVAGRLGQRNVREVNAQS